MMRVFQQKLSLKSLTLRDGAHEVTATCHDEQWKMEKCDTKKISAFGRTTYVISSHICYTGPLFYLTNIACHFRQSLCGVCGRRK